MLLGVLALVLALLLATNVYVSGVMLVPVVRARVGGFVPLPVLGFGMCLDVGQRTKNGGHQDRAECRSEAPAGGC